MILDAEQEGPDSSDRQIGLSIVKSHPVPVVLRVGVVHLHDQSGTDPSERVQDKPS